MKGYLFLVIIFICHLQIGFAQLNLQLKKLDASGLNISTSEYPVLTAYIKVTNNGNQVELSKDNIKILENNALFTAKAMELSPIVDGWQILKWIPEQYMFTFQYQCIIYALYNNELTNNYGIGKLNRAPYTIVTDQDNLQIRDVFWSYVQPGNSIPYQVRFRSWVDTESPDGPVSLKLDSITTNSKYFEVKWVGSDSDNDRAAPPRNLRVGSSYWANIYFKPDAYAYYQDILTFHYEGGLKRIVPLYGNSYTVQTKSMIQLISPNGGEKLAPCETFQIKWRGYAPQFPVELYYSTNGGFTWQLIDQVKDSVYNWTVPDIDADKLIVKVRQNFNQNDIYYISKDTRNTLDAAYNQFSTQLSFVNQIGNIFTYDLNNLPPAIKNSQYLNSENDANEYTSLGMVYSPYDSLYYVAYYSNNIPYYSQKDTIAVFNANDKYPINKITLNQNIRIKKIKADNSNQMISVIPTFGNRVFIYDSKNFQLIKTLTFDTQVIDFSFNTKLNQAAALLLDGEIEIIDLKNYSIIKELKYNEFPNFVQLALSPNGKLLSIGTKADKSGLKTNIYVIEIETGKIVRVFTPSNGDPIGLFFNPSSSTLITGSVSDKQIAFYDLSTSKNTGELYGHSTIMNDIKLAPNGLSLISTASGNDNAVYRTFVYPEEDLSDSTLSILRPALNLDKIVFDPVYLGTKNEYKINKVCNISEVEATFASAKFKLGWYFNLKNNWGLTQLKPGQCLDFDIVFTPLDTGIIRDTLAIHSCNSDYLLPIEIKVLPRNIEYLSANYDFGDVCIGDTITKRLDILKNNDPVPLIVNYLNFNDPHNRNFSVTIANTDTIIPPNGTLAGIVRFYPDTLGYYYPIMTIYHSNQEKINGTFTIKGKGIGSYIELSHNKLLFIPEVLTREFTIKNTGITDINFDDFRIIPPDNFEFISSKKFVLKPNESTLLKVRWNGIKEKANLIIDATPCLAQNNIPLDFFDGMVELTIPRVETSAKNENLEIPIQIKPNDKEPYKGVRPFEATFEVNPKIFLPTSVSSDIGEASLISNNVNGNREFKIRVEANFDNPATIAIIKGVAGLTDTNYSDLIIKEPSAKFGEYVNTIVRNGGIFINDICGDRYIQNEKNIVMIQSIAPNPANDFVKIVFEAETTDPLKIEMIDNMGNQICVINNYRPRIGTNELTFNTSKCEIGNYNFNIYYLNKIKSSSFIIMR